MKVHSLITIAVIVMGVLIQITKTEWLVIILCIGGVVSTELINSAIEKICDKQTTQKDKLIRDIKDIAAGAVLFMAIAAAACGILIFLPYLIK